jgi:transcriptional regulator with XRE-family HTH domain
MTATTTRGTARSARLPASAGRRSCRGCGSALSRYNPAPVCQSCQRESGAQPASPADVSVRGARLGDLRRRRGLTQKMLVGRAGVSFSIVEKLERNTRKSAQLSTLGATACVLRVPVSELLDPEAAMTGRPRSGAGDNPGNSPARPPTGDISATRIYMERKARCWPVRKMAEVLRAMADDPGNLPPVYALIRMIYRWETGKHVPSELYRLLYCKSFAMTEDDLFTHPHIRQIPDAAHTCRIPVEIARRDYGEITGPVSLAISLTLPCIPDRVVIDISVSPAGERGTAGSAHSPQAAAGHLTLVPRDLAAEVTAT